MVKGQAMILLVIVLLAVIFIFFSSRIFSTQPVITDQLKFKNDIITLENFEVSNLRPVVNSKVIVSFDVTNNGDKEIENVIVDFGGTTKQKGGVVELTCDPFSSSVNDVTKTGNDKCKFQKLESLETRKVTYNMQVVNEGTLPIVINVSYPYSGTREAFITIVDDKTVKTPQVQFRQSPPSVGPLVVDVAPPTKGWAVSDQPFAVKFRLRFVGSTATGIPLPSVDKIGIEKRKLGVKLTNLIVPKKRDGTFLSCSGFKEGTIAISQPTASPGEFRGGLTNVEYSIVNTEREILVNKDYDCNLQADVKANDPFGYKLGNIDVDFFYTFEFLKIQNINVIRAA